MSDESLVLDPVSRLTKDLINAAKITSKVEARYLVDAYYIIQRNRITAANQVRELEETHEPNTVLQWLGEQNRILEHQLKRALDKWTDNQHMGVWAKSICGIGPVISAGLLAHIDIEKAPTAGHIWSFAGLIPGIVWKKGEKRPFNARLKTLCAYKLGESFVKFQNHKADVYGKIFKTRKELELQRNESGAYAEQAKMILEKFNFNKTTDAYKAYSAGKLPPAHIHARARRYAVKLFLSHYHGEYYRHHFGKEPPLPYPIAFMGHTHMIESPVGDLDIADFDPNEVE